MLKITWWALKVNILFSLDKFKSVNVKYNLLKHAYKYHENVFASILKGCVGELLIRKLFFCYVVVDFIYFAMYALIKVSFPTGMLDSVKNNLKAFKSRRLYLFIVAAALHLILKY